eukprot:scaffold1621_cov350-Prasinococcus_capsulatus_cf.AAC.16
MRAAGASAAPSGRPVGVAPPAIPNRVASLAKKCVATTATAVPKRRPTMSCWKRARLWSWWRLRTSKRQPRWPAT